MFISPRCLVLLGIALAPGVFAQAPQPLVDVAFREAAPTDLFSIHNRSEGEVRITALNIDLTPSQGQALFDVQEGGLGVMSVYPFTVQAGDDVTGFVAVVGDDDGSRNLWLEFEHFDPGEEFVFGIDVDDTAEGGVPGQNRITADELNGTIVEIVFELPDGTATTETASILENRLVMGVGGAL